MNVTFQLPDEIAGELKLRWNDLSRHALQAVAAAAYREGLITRAQVGQVLGLGSRFSVDEFLHRAGAPRPYDEADVEQDLAAIARAEGSKTACWSWTTGLAGKKRRSSASRLPACLESSCAQPNASSSICHRR
jgi:hypothetical protein